MAALKKYIFETQISDFKTIAPGFAHVGKWWVRLSAQVYNDLDDFRIVARALKEVCGRLNRGEWKEGEKEREVREVREEGTGAEEVK